MTERSERRAPNVASAVARDEEPTVFVASAAGVLGRVPALKRVAQSHAAEIPLAPIFEGTD